MEIKTHHEGYLKWGCLAGAIVALEYYGSESLTTHARRALEHPIGKIAVPLAIGVTTLHLLDRMPPELDPYEIIGSAVQRYRDGREATPTN